MDELQELRQRLATLRTLKPTNARRAEAEALLESKWEGVQVSAAQVLGEWDGPDSVPPLRSWLSQLYSRPNAWGARSEAARALGKCVGEPDVSWALDLYFSLGGPKDAQELQHELFPLLEGLPRRSTLEILQGRAALGEEAAARALRRLEATAEVRHVPRHRA
jgi:HEAT repeat protein